MSKKQKIILTRGLPASGKSTWAKEFVKNSNGKAKRVNKDDLREMIDAGVYSKTNEQMILNARDNLICNFIEGGAETIIVDDTNFEEKHFDNIKGLTDAFNNLGRHNITVEYKDFLDVPLEDCLHRDSLRPKPVGEKVIKSMHQRYILPTIKEGPVVNKKGNAIIVDIDGTLAHRCDRQWFDYSKVDQDELDVTVDGIVRAYAKMGYIILIVSGREATDECYHRTNTWLKKHNIPYYDLMMRKQGDFRRDSIVKKEIYDNDIKGKFDVEFVLDDRQQVVDMWREIGLKCLQVAPGNF